MSKLTKDNISFIEQLLNDRRQENISIINDPDTHHFDKIDLQEQINQIELCQSNLQVTVDL